MLSYILKALYRTKDHHKMRHAKYSNPLTLRIIEKKPLYVTDGRCCIQASLSQLEIEPNPFNRVSMPYYAPVMEKPHILFNCSEKDTPDEAVKYPSPYHPCFFFKNYDNFKKFRTQTKVLLSCEVLKVQ